MWRKNPGGDRITVVNKIMCFLECGYNFQESEKEEFHRCVNLDAHKQWTRLA